MKVSTSIKLDAKRFVQQAAIMQADNCGSAIDAFIEFINNDSGFKLKLQRSLMSRLKYSTGKLYESIRIKAKRDESVKVTDFGLSANWKIDVFIDIDDSRGKSLINALLGEKEQKKNVELPKIGDLIDWVAGKRRFFDKQIDAIKSRQDRVRKLLQIQRMELGGSGKFNMPKNTNFKDPKREIAHIIQRRMALRMEKGLSPTKGSEFVFLGNYPDYSQDGEKRGQSSSFSPKYRKEGEPLLRKRRKEEGGKIVGEMNRIVSQEAYSYFVGIMDKYVASGLKINTKKEARESEIKISTGEQYKNQVSEQIRKIAPKFVSKKLRTVTKLEDSIFDLFNQVRNIRNKTKNKWFNEGQSLIMREILATSKYTMKLAKDTNLNVSKEIDEIIVELRNFGGYVAPAKKRPARRRR